MLIVKVLGLLLLHVALVTPGTQICHDPDENAYSIITCGAPGKDGLPGTNGKDGAKGEHGEPGLPGPPGKTGQTGPRGEQGPAGPVGEKGATGLPGGQGIAGPTGARGEKGADGQPGTPGKPGVAGPAGPKGETGNSGPSGPPGPKGERGDSGTSVLESLKLQVAAMDKRLMSLQSRLEKQEKACAFSKVTSRRGDKIYVSNGVEATYSEAKASCAAAGGQLAAPRNSEENQAIFSFRSHLSQHAFMGITDIQTEGVFRYLSGETITYSNWAPNEPNNFNGDEDCVEIRDAGMWNDQNCSFKRFYICEF